MNSEISSPLKRFDMSFFISVASIFIIGILNLYSATHSNEADQYLFRAQIIWFLIAMATALGICFVHPKTFFRLSYVVYFVNCLLLVVTLVVGKTSLGATRWLAIGPIRFQPSEMMKLSLVLALARYYARARPDKELTLKDLIAPGLIAFIPAILVIVQPDLGTGLMLIFIFLVMTFYRKLTWRSIAIVALLGGISAGVMYKFGLKEYQRKRIHTFIDPFEDAKGAGYNAIQSEIAIGSGRLFGKGFKKSSQASLAYLPENHTDFVFSIFNEEHGFFGSIVLITLYIILLLRFVNLAYSVNKFFDSVVTIGLMSIFFGHTFINMGMVTGLLPIVGIPLPLMSYGGTSLLTFGVCTGLATSISNSRKIF